MMMDDPDEWIDFKRVRTWAVIGVISAALTAFGWFYSDMYSASGRVANIELDHCPEQCLDRCPKPCDSEIEQIKSRVSKLEDIKFCGEPCQDRIGDLDSKLSGIRNLLVTLIQIQRTGNETDVKLNYYPAHYRDSRHRDYRRTATVGNHNGTNRDSWRNRFVRDFVDPLFEPPKIRNPLQGG